VELFAEFVEELDRIIAFHSDVIGETGRELDTLSLYAHLLHNQVDDAFCNFGHAPARIRSPCPIAGTRFRVSPTEIKSA
jgi:hypothetical protein